ncbi:MAG: hypothetical protein RIS70_2364 [Planctomycetota bacterium]|jgi:hypothetical protein
MVSPERALWHWLNQRMGGHWCAQRIESIATAPGIPDVYFSCSVPADLRGWIELKSYAHWGADHLPFDVPSWTSDQRNWMQRHHAHGGRGWLVVEYRDSAELLVLPDRFALVEVGRLKTAAVRNMLYSHPRRGLDANGILDALLQP